MFFLCRKIDASEPVPQRRTAIMAKQIAIAAHNNTFTQQQKQNYVRAQNLTRKTQAQRTLELNALQRKLQRIQDHNPAYHGPWVDYREHIETRFQEEIREGSPCSISSRFTHQNKQEALWHNIMENF